MTDSEKLKCELCGDRESELLLRSRCHSTAPFQVSIVNEEIILRCYLPECGREVGRFKLLTDSALKEQHKREKEEYGRKCYYQGREHGGENVKDIERRHEAELREAFMAGAEYDFRYYGDPENPGIETYPRYETYEDYRQSKAKERGE